MQHRHSCFENQATINKKAREMKRPYIMVHMMTSLDGRIDCPVMAQISGDEYYEALDELGKCSKLSGRATAAWENSAVECEVSDVKGTVKGEESVNVAVKSDEYTIVMDTHGHLQWNNNTADGFPLLCIMSEDVTEEHLQALQNRGISWISTGKGTADLARAMQLAYERFGIERIAVVGGGHICGGFLASGLVDEVSVMVAPGIDGRKGQTAVFDGIIKDNDTPYRLKLNKVSQWEGTDVVWLRYTVKH